MPVIGITGYGCITCAGDSPTELWNSAIHGTSGIRDGLGRISVPFGEVTSDIIGRLGSRYEALADFPPFLTTLAAIGQAREMAGWQKFDADDGFIFATTTGQVPLWEPTMMRFCRGEIDEQALARTFRFEPLGATLQALCRAIDFPGRTQLITTACAASTHALALARLWLLQGIVKRCLVGGAEALSRLTVEGFRSFQLLSPEIAKPFDEKRTGINLSEGAAFLCLERDTMQPCRAILSGGAFSSDAYHMTAPHPEGKGCLAAMRAALTSADLTPKDIAWVHAHGTGSPHNDLAESLAIRALFGEAMPPVSSTKAVHGHALAASGAVETVLCVVAMENHRVLRTQNLEVPDPKIPLRHAAGSEPLYGHVLKNTLGFGGSNAAIVLSPGDFS